MIPVTFKRRKYGGDWTVRNRAARPAVFWKDYWNITGSPTSCHANVCPF